MAVEARHLNLFPPQIVGNRREMMMNGVGSNACHNMYDPPLSYGGFFSSTVVVVPASASNDAVPVKNAPLQSDSGLTYAAAVPVASRKREREVVLSSNHQMTSLPILNVSPNHHDDAIANNRIGGGGGSFTFLEEDVSPHLLQHHSDVDRFIAQYTEKVRLEVQHRRNQYSREITATVEESVMKKLKAKEAEIERIGKLNCMLEERVKFLSMENQIWRELAQSNEATANALRSNLEQVLAQVQVHDDHHQLQVRQPPPETFADDAQSCCGSNYNGEEKGDELTSNSPTNNNINRICRSCGREESCVLILPCRHLCVCTACSSSVDACPVCNSTKTRSLHVNLSS